MTSHVFRDILLVFPGRNIQVRYSTLLVCLADDWKRRASV